MTCTRPGCGNIQCYVCHKSCDYNHFNDEARGGKKGNCPLFDDTAERHDNEVRAAQRSAQDMVAEKHPDVDVRLLEIRLSDKVKLDDQRRKMAANPGGAALAG